MSGYYENGHIIGTCGENTAVEAVPEFQSFPRMPRLMREIIITEKLDGTNAQIYINEDASQMTFGSRNRWLTPDADNFGFARWGCEHKEELLHLGPGRHFGEWFGAGIQRRYGLNHKRFALFNTIRWVSDINSQDGLLHLGQEVAPACCTVVPVLYRGPFSESQINTAFALLGDTGSKAVPGFTNPEGIVVFHTAAKQCFKRTFEHDDTGKPE